MARGRRRRGGRRGSRPRRSVEQVEAGVGLARGDAGGPVQVLHLERPIVVGRCRRGAGAASPTISGA